MSFNVILVGLPAGWEVTSKAMDGLRVEPRGLSSLRIAMRLLSDTRSVLEYLPKLSLSIRG